MNDDDKHYLKILEKELAEAEDLLQCELLSVAILRETIAAHTYMREMYENAQQVAHSLSVPQVKGIPVYIAEANAAASKVYGSIYRLKTLEIQRDELTLSIKTRYAIPTSERRAKDCKDRLLKFLKQQEEKKQKSNEKAST